MIRYDKLGNNKPLTNLERAAFKVRQTKCWQGPGPITTQAARKGFHTVQPDEPRQEGARNTLSWCLLCGAYVRHPVNLTNEPTQA